MENLTDVGDTHKLLYIALYSQYPLTHIHKKLWKLYTT